MGTVYRYERSGVMHGLLRVRGFTQDDAHIFCTEEQVAEEFRGCLEMTQSVLASLGMDRYRVRLGFRDPNGDKYVGGREIWDRAEASLKAVCESMNLPDMSIEQGEAAFYGPKADFVVTDCIGREWQLGTVQLDYVLPERLGATYVAEDGTRKYAVMLHRAILGSLERFIGMLIEHYAGKMPMWLAPTQVVVATIVSEADDYARKLVDRLQAGGIRAELDARNEKINYKVREHSVQKVPLLFVVGKREAEEGTVSVRRLGTEGQKVVPANEAIVGLMAEAVPPDLKAKQAA
jgi:threonyl-tRNA synthetase